MIVVGTTLQIIKGRLKVGYFVIFMNKKIHKILKVHKCTFRIKEKYPYKDKFFNNKSF